MSDEQQDTFYELNVQCWRCRMYIPRVEMKYHAGQLLCPICFQDETESGGKCRNCHGRIPYGEHGLCHSCREKEEKRKETGLAGGGHDIAGWRPYTGLPDSGAGQKTGSSGSGEAHGRGIVVCSGCRGNAEPAVWQDGQPYCPNCAKGFGGVLPIRVVKRISRMLKGIVKPRERVRAKADGREEKGKSGGRKK